ncbi:MAG: hypothetical protein IKB71_01040 [Lentisphaeria bacterium]|nr:hypothetical protein [Lentisphaeria bacterium]
MMVKNCEHFKSISRCALLLMLTAGSSVVAADAAKEQLSPGQLRIREVIATETEVRKQILADIDMQKKNIEQMLKKDEFPEASAACDAMVRQLAKIPGTLAAQKLDEMREFRRSLRRKWAAYVLEKSQDLYDENKYEEAIALCSTITIIDEENGNAVTAPFIEKCHKAIKAREYKIAIDVKNFDKSIESDAQAVDRYMREAQTFYNNGKYEDVIAVLEKVYLLDPFNVRATTLLDKTYGKIYSYARARHRVTNQEMMAMDEWNWVMPLKIAQPQNDKISRRSPEIKIAKNEVEARLEKITLPKFDSPGMGIVEILNFLVRESKKYDPEGVTIIHQLSKDELASPKFKRIYMNFNAIPLREILRYLCVNLGLKYKINQDGNVLIGTSIDDMVSSPREFLVRDDLIADITSSGAAPAAAAAEPAEGGTEGAAAAPAATAANSSADVAKMKKYFSDRGISFPAGSSIRYNKRKNCLEVINSEENLRKLDELLLQLSAIEVPMVMTEVKFIEVSEKDFNQLGFDWNFSLTDETRGNGLWNFSTSTNFVTQEEQNNRPTAFIQNLNLLPNFDDDWGGLKPSLNVTVHALSQNDNAEVLTTPRLISKSGMSASIRMVTETRYPDSWEAPEIETESDNITTISFPVPDLGDPTPIGITMNVTPTVNPDNTITLDLRPEIITFLGSANSGYPVSVQQGVVNRETGQMVPTMLNESFNIWMPEMGVRRIDVKVKVEDGETIVLGGIISNTVERQEEKMPLLGTIPLLGRLFQNRKEESSKTNLLIFVTARLINTDGRPVKMIEDNGTPHFNF